MYGNLEVDKVKIFVLSEDVAGFDSPMHAVHGISLLLEIQTSNHKKSFFLFDVSQSSEIVLYNMNLLGISPDCVDLVFLSHCHYDHTGGLLGMVKAIEKQDLPVVAHPTILRSSYGLKPNLKHSGVPRGCYPDRLKEFARMVLVDNSFSLLPGVVSTGEVKREVPFEKNVTIKSFREKNGKLIPDEMKDDISLVINLKGKGLLPEFCTQIPLSEVRGQVAAIDLVR